MDSDSTRARAAAEEEAERINPWSYHEATDDYCTWNGGFVAGWMARDSRADAVTEATARHALEVFWDRDNGGKSAGFLACDFDESEVRNMTAAIEAAMRARGGE